MLFAGAGFESSQPHFPYRRRSGRQYAIRFFVRIDLPLWGIVSLLFSCTIHTCNKLSCRKGRDGFYDYAHSSYGPLAGPGCHADTGQYLRGRGVNDTKLPKLRKKAPDCNNGDEVRAGEVPSTGLRRLLTCATKPTVARVASEQFGSDGAVG
jgi:hypothetical protein